MVEKIKEKKVSASISPSTTSSLKLRSTSKAVDDKKATKDKKVVVDKIKKTPASTKAMAGKEKKVANESVYYEAVGRRKTSVARVRLFTKGVSGIIVNDKKLEEYFVLPKLRNTVEDPLRKMKLVKKFKITVKVSGGGISSQAGALSLGIARSLIKFNPDFRKRLKKAGFLTRDPRAKERRKFGLKKARKAAQWRKR